MSEIIGLQMRFFLTSILSGVVLLVVYDCIRILRRIIRHSRFLVSIEDLLFWITSSILIFVMMFQQNNGTIRGFSIMGMLFGMITYNIFISRYVVNGMSKLIQLILSIITRMFQFILKPFQIAFKTIKKKSQNVLDKLRRLIQKNRKNLVKCLIKAYKTIKISITKE